jgi:hypothetical protein
MKSKNSYNVRLEFITRHSKFLEVEIEAGSEDEARNIAVLRASENLDTIDDFIDGEEIDTIVDTCCANDWQVEKINTKDK